MISKMFLYSVIIFSLIFLSEAAIKPKYIIPCSRSRNFSECAVKNAQYAISFLVKGDRQLKIASMNPLKVELIELKGTSNLNLKLKNVEVYGLDKLKILSMTSDFDKNVTQIISALEKCNILADYEINGKMLIFPIVGHGPLNMTIFNGIYKYDGEWDIITRNGKQYTNLTKSKYDYEVSKIIYNFKNLFNGDKMLGDQMNKFLNENWELVNQDLKAPFLETLLVFHNDVTRKIFNQIPFDELFLE